MSLLSILSCITLYGQGVQDTLYTHSAIVESDSSHLGWYGKSMLSAGSLIYTETQQESFSSGNKFLYNGDFLLSNLSEYDRFVIFAKGYNVLGDNDRVSGAKKKGLAYNPFLTIPGLQTVSSVGANYRTNRLNLFSVSVTASYKHNTRDGLSMYFRKIKQSDRDDMYSVGNESGYGIQDLANFSLTFENKDQKKYLLKFTPSFVYDNSKVNTIKESMVLTLEDIMNESESRTISSYQNISATGDLEGGIKDMAKKGRSIMAKLRYGHDEANGERKDISNNYEMSYKIGGNRTSVVGGISYEEPIGERWLLRGNLESEYTKLNEEEIAYDIDGNMVSNYSSTTENIFYREKIEFSAQYYDKVNKVQAGLQSIFRQSVTSAVSKGFKSVSGKGEWLDNWIPFINYEYLKGKNIVSLKYEGTSSGLAISDVTPNVNVSNPTRIVAGNIYLKPSFKHILKTKYKYSNDVTKSLFDISFEGTNENGKVVSAIWYDSDGIRYTVPVNTQRPGFSSVVQILYKMPFGNNSQFRFEVKGRLKYDSKISYQAKGKLPGIDLYNFNYENFIGKFWGSPNGDLFYSGESGFVESFTRSLNSSAEVMMGYRISILDIAVMARVNHIFSRYSINPMDNENIWNNMVGNTIKVTPGRDWEILNKLEYKFYSGYSDGYGRSEALWSIYVGKKIKSMTIALKLDDILNQRQNLSYKVNADYAEESHTNLIGRHFLLSLSFDFGRLQKSGRAQIDKVVRDMMK